MKLYALPYYATARHAEDQGGPARQVPARQPPRAGTIANDNRDKAVDLLVKEFPNLIAPTSARRVEVHAAILVHRAHQGQQAGAAMDPAVWQDQIDLYAQLGQFTARYAHGWRRS